MLTTLQSIAKVILAIYPQVMNRPRPLGLHIRNDVWNKDCKIYTGVICAAIGSVLYPLHVASHMILTVQRMTNVS